MISPIRIFNQNGIQRFQILIHNFKQGATSAIPEDLLTSDYYSDPVPNSPNVENARYPNKLALVQYLLPKVKALDMSDPYDNQRMWAWLSAFFFDTVCPPDDNGRRDPKAEERHIPASVRVWKRFYRHLLATPVRLYDILGEEARIYLTGAPYEQGDFYEQLVSRQGLGTSPTVVGAATHLYWDKERLRLKNGAASAGRPGNVRRFAGPILKQFERTYDLNSLTSERLLDLLPAEFDAWK
jgi:hypothetical protein